MAAVRQNRVDAFTAWLRTIDGQPPFHQRPEFRFFADLSPDEFSLAAETMEADGEQLNAEADALKRQVGAHLIDQIIPFPSKVTTDHIFGGCPVCGKTDGYMNVGGNHWFVCEPDNTAWSAGYNLFSGWRAEPAELHQANERRLRTMRIIEPIYPIDPDRAA